MKSNIVGWFEIYVQDMPRAKAFYEKVFGLTLQKLDSPELELWAFPMSMSESGAPGALVHMKGVLSGGNSTIVYFKCDDCAEEAKRAEQSGGRIMKDKFSIGQYGYIALVFDTEGNVIGLHSMK
jgi:predicted enzyme related to lactoylglutathione lyase